MPRRREQGVRRRELHDPAAKHHRHPVADMLDQPKVVGNEKVGQLQPILQLISKFTICACTDTSSAETGSSAMTNEGLERQRACEPIRWR